MSWRTEMERRQKDLNTDNLTLRCRLNELRREMSILKTLLNFQGREGCDALGLLGTVTPYSISFAGIKRTLKRQPSETVVDEKVTK